MGRIVYASFVDLSGSIGPSVNEVEFVDALITLKDRPIIITPEPQGKLRETIKSHAIYTRKFRNNFISWVFFQLSMYRLLRKALKLGGRKFVVRLDFFPMAILLFFQFYNTEFIVKTAGDGEYRFLKNHSLVFRFLLPIVKFVVRRILCRAKKIDVVSERHRQALCRNFSVPTEKVVVVDNFVNTNMFRPMSKGSARNECGIPDDGLVIGYAGNSPYSRGGKELLTIKERLEHRLNRKVYVLSLGGGKDLALLREEAKRLNIDDDVFLPGQVDYKEVPRYINCMDVGVSFLQEDHRGASEQKVRQYLACGVVPIVTPGGSDFVERDRIGFVTENKDISDMLPIFELAVSTKDSLAEDCVRYAKEHMSHLNSAKSRLGFFS